MAYILLKEKYPGLGIKHAQTLFERDVQARELKKSLQILSQINGGNTLKSIYRSVIKESEKKMAA